MDRELTRYRNGAVGFLLALIIGTLALVPIMSAAQDSQRVTDQERRTCQMSAVAQGASLDRAQLMCRGY